jgi:hypothetical protein
MTELIVTLMVTNFIFILFFGIQKRFMSKKMIFIYCLIESKKIYFYTHFTNKEIEDWRHNYEMPG